MLSRAIVVVTTQAQTDQDRPTDEHRKTDKHTFIHAQQAQMAKVQDT